MLVGKAPRLGSRAIIDLHYDGMAALPIEAHFNNTELQAIQSLLHAHVSNLEGVTDFNLKAKLQPEAEVQIQMEPVTLTHLNGVRVRGQGLYQKNQWHARLQTLSTVPMIVTLDGETHPSRWKCRATVEGYDAALVRSFYTQTWVNRLAGPGNVGATMQSGPRGGAVLWSVEGTHFDLEGTALHVPEWSAQGGAQGISVYVRGTTDDGGTAEVAWAKPAAASDATLQVDVSSVTVRQVLQIFKLESKPASRVADAMNPYGYEKWLIDKASMESTIESTGSLTVQDSDIDLAGMHVDLSGTFDLGKAKPMASIQGDAMHLPVSSVLESFFSPPATLTGTAQADFQLQFPLSAGWLRGMNGSIDLQITNGVLRSLKTIYRIVSVLNLGNYLRLRFPQVAAQGITFESIAGHLVFKDGFLSTEDLFLKSPNMNVGAKGWVDVPGKHMDATLRLEMFRFLEDVLRDVPITHWIFKKPNKIFLPLVVRLLGPWDDMDIR
jgi:hypothetical protein